MTDTALVPTVAEFTRQPRIPSPLDEVVRAAAEKLMTLQMARLVLEPEHDDLQAVLADMEVLTSIVDQMFLDAGRYWGEYFGISADKVRDYFENVSRATLEGNADFVLTEAFRDMQESKMDGFAPYWERS